MSRHLIPGLNVDLERDPVGAISDLGSASRSFATCRYISSIIASFSNIKRQDGMSIVFKVINEMFVACMAATPRHHRK